MNSEIESLNDVDVADAAMRVVIARQLSSPVDADTYFSVPVREQRMNLLLHLAAISELVLVVGETGSGKTTFAQHFLRLGAERWHIVVLQLENLTDDKELITLLMNALDENEPAAPHDTDAESIADRINAYLDQEKPIIVLIDNAHLISGRGLKALEDLFNRTQREDRSLHMVLVGDPELETQLDSPEFADLLRRMVHSIDLPPYDEEQTIRYIHQRLGKSAMALNSLLDAGNMKRIYKDSQGFPGRVDAAIERMLSSEEPSARKRGSTSDDRPLRGFLTAAGGRWRYILPLGLIVVFFAVMLALRMVATETGPAQSLMASQDQSVKSPTKMPPPLAVQNRDHVTGEPTGSSNEGNVDEAQSIGTAAEHPETDQLPPLPEEVSPPATTVVEKQEPEVIAPAVPSTTGDAEQVSAVVPAPIPKNEVVADEEQAVQTTEPDAGSEAVEQATAESPATAKTAIKEKATEKAQAEGKIHDAAWILKQAADSYTLQLLASRNRDAVLKFMENISSDEPRAYFTNKKSGSEWYVVILGVYPDRAAASQAIGRLGAKLREMKPWPRSISGIHALIKQNQAGTS